MNTTITAWGNSLGVRIPKSYANDLGIEKGSDIEIVRTGNFLVLKPRKEKKRNKYNIEDLAKGMNTKNQHSEVDWNEPVGNEVW